MNKSFFCTDETKLAKRLSEILPLDEDAMKAAKERQDYRVKVPTSLGRLEDMSIRLAGITGKVYGNNVDKQAIVLMCADNGVVDEGVASAPQMVTLMQTINFTKRITGVGAQAAYFGIDILDIDVGVKLPVPPEYLAEDMLVDGMIQPLVVDRRIADGTKNLAKEPALTREEAIAAIMVGIEATDAIKAAGKQIYGVGEMGIGNSTTAACIISAITGIDAEKIVGRGGGLNDEGLNKKYRVVSDAVTRYATDDPIELAASLGGYDICAMAGAYLGAAINRIPVVIDGYISISAALLAAEIAPAVKDFMFTSHFSQEPGYKAAVKKLGIRPMFDLEMKLGEASGCPIAFKIMEASCAVMNGMESLEEGQIDDSYLDELREKNLF